jgi:hypothetical protein
VYLFLASFSHTWQASFSAYVGDIWSLMLVDFCLHIFSFLRTSWYRRKLKHMLGFFIYKFFCFSKWFSFLRWIFMCLTPLLILASIPSIMWRLSLCWSFCIFDMDEFFLVKYHFALPFLVLLCPWKNCSFCFDMGALFIITLVSKIYWLAHLYPGIYMKSST